LPVVAAMKIFLKDIFAVPTELAYAELVEELNRTLALGSSRDYEFSGPLDVRVTFHRSGADLFFEGEFHGVATATCARCLSAFPLQVTNTFSVVLTPETPLTGEIELKASDMTESFYSGTEVDLTRLIYDQVLLALPTRPLCDEECRGLCPQCGVNRNSGRCSCAVEAGDARLAVLRTLKVDRGV
jgi:uncharacterized protein